MTIATAPELVDAIQRLHLLEAGQLAELAARAQQGDARALARDLIQRGWLTPFQVNQLFLGRGQDLLLGSYVLLERLGEGGMGAGFKARHWKLGTLVALKKVRKDHIASPAASRRFRREIEVAAQVNHPNLVRAFDADEVEGAHLLVMEYVPGTDLHQVVRKSGPLPVAEACDYVRQAALGLQHAHESSDGKLIATGTGANDAGEVIVWDAATLNPLQPYEGEEKGSGGLAFSPDGKLLAAAPTTSHVVIWDSATREVRSVLLTPDTQSRLGVFSPDGRVLVTAGHGRGGPLLLWDHATGRPLARLQGLNDMASDWSGAAAFTPDGRTLITGANKIAKVWDISAFSGR